MQKGKAFRKANKSEDEQQAFARNQWFQEDPIHLRLNEKLDQWAQEDDFCPVDDTFDFWYLLSQGISLEEALPLFLKSELYKPGLFRNCIRISDDSALPADSQERNLLLERCAENRITIIKAGVDDDQFYNLNENCAFEIAVDEVYGAWDEIRLTVRPLQLGKVVPE